MQLLALSALTDNYIWLLHDTDGNALVVDPGEAGPAEAALERHRLQLRAILLTHHHPDHTAGAVALRERHGATVCGPHDARIPAIDRQVGASDVLAFDAPAASFTVIEVPGHTRTHVAYVGEGLLFCGDTLFSMGCGRLFEGTPEQMLDSLDRLAALPPDIRVCCGHEYTAANGRFAQTVDPENPAIAQRMTEVAALCRDHRPTLPVSLHTELQTNPFLRIDTPALVDWASRQGVECDDRPGRFGALRAAKDVFRA